MLYQLGCTTGAADRSQDGVDLAREHQLEPEAGDGDHGDARVLELLVRARVRVRVRVRVWVRVRVRVRVRVA
jgi:hypothetical protein